MRLDKIQTRSRSFAEVLRIVRRVAVTDANVLISGETGTGKDFVAGLIHDASPRSGHPFLKIDCASIPFSLAESELFGYEKGAFSDASQSKMGKLLLANGGTVYLDGINNLPGVVQSKLLRFVQERKIEPLGSSQTFQIDCRIIASCAQPLKECLEQRQLREDLYYRLASVAFELPPLRERINDIDLLARSLLKELNLKYRKKTKFPAETMSALKSYRWPGNIRELRNTIEQAVIHSDGVILATDLDFKESLTTGESLSFLADQMLSLDELESRYIAEVLRRVKGHQGKAAKVLKINRKTLLIKKRKYRLE